ncbi:MAG: hypothetical protein KKF41_14630 [Actinobacteria bacterium]|nr:hypothetical protein [Actinomycetota bacterium]MBU1944258.1 hypothetical protein [Actinomycetota bacterium]MBU2688811.1 hypothetical protein [Actinomycetota bacterium]
MTQLEKLVRKARTAPQNVRFSELVKIVSRVGGYELYGRVGSHCSYRKKEQYSLTLTATSGLAKVEEVKKVIRRLGEEGLI